MKPKPPKYSAVRHFALLALALTLGAPTQALAAPGAAATDAAADTVLARRGDVVVTQADFETELQRIPAERRAAFAASSRRNRELISRLMQTAELAALAREQKVDQDPATRRRLQLEQDRLLAGILSRQVEEAAERDFDARRTSFERRALELYAAGGASSKAPATVTFTQVFFAAAKDGFDGAKKRAAEALAKVRAGADMGELAVAISDDPGARDSRGRMGPIARPQLEPAFADAVFALKKPGDLSEPVKSRVGWHIIRLDESKAPAERTFDEVKAEIMAELRKKQVDEAREALLQGLGKGKETYVNDAAIEALRGNAKPDEADSPTAVQ